jgi:hypothetical protein
VGCPGRAWAILGFTKLKEACAKEPETLIIGWCMFWSLLAEFRCFARWDTMPFYTQKGMVYNAWFMGVSTTYIWAKLLLGSLWTTCIGRLTCPQGHDDMPAMLWPPHSATMAEAMRISIYSLMHVLDPDLEATGSSDNGMHLYCLTGVHITIRIIACSLICNRDLACGKDTWLDYCDVVSAARELDMAII